MVDTDTASIADTDVHRFFDDFDEAFATFDGDVIGRRFAMPYLAGRSDGSAEVFGDATAVGRYFGAIVADHHERGVRSCTHRDVDVVDLGGGHALATVTWDLRDEEGSVTTSWRESYVLVTTGERLLVRASIDFPDGAVDGKD